MLKDAIIRAAELTGRDNEGADGLIGYCQFLATNEPRAFASLMGRVLPLQVEGTGADGVVVFKTVYEEK